MGALHFGTQPRKGLKGEQVVAKGEKKLAKRSRKMKFATAAALGLQAAFLLALAVSASAQEGTRDEKLISLFNIVKFPNDVCAGGTRNGTCYTAEECTKMGGTNDGKCAGDYGVCCVVKLACGASSSENNTYLINPEKVTSCTYSVCPM